VEREEGWEGRGSGGGGGEEERKEEIEIKR
jgi:hypothetical protein